MSEPQDEAEKHHEATPQKLLEARKKGELAKSNDLLTAAAYAGLLAALLMTGADGIKKMGSALMTVMDQAHELGPLFLSDGISPAMGGLLFAVAMALAPFFLFRFG